MIIIVCIYNTQLSGNYTSEEIDIPTNHISVSILKTIINKKYQIDPSLQRLTTKILNTLVTMTDEWPLSFFELKNKFIVYLEQIQDNSNDIKSKAINKAKSKYMSQLSIYNRKQSTIMSTIEESPNEFHDDCLNSQDNSYIIEVVITATKNNNITQLKELIEQYNAQNLDELGTNGWNALHYASFFGYDEIVNILVTNGKCNPNIKNKEGWTCLHFVALKGNYSTASILIALDDIKPDINVDVIGTPLHIACKNNYFKTSSVLLYKANPNIKDSNGKFPKDLTTSLNIIKLIEKIFKNAQETEGELKRRDSLLNTSQSSQRSNNRNFTGYEFIAALDFKPPKPPKAIGFVQKEGKRLPVFRYRYIEVDPLSGTLKRFKTIKDYPNKPNEILSLSRILRCTKAKVFLTSDDIFYFELICDSRELYRVDNLVACETWVNVINSSCIYAKFWSCLSQKYKKTSDYLSNEKTETIIIDGDTGEIRTQSRNKGVYNLPKVMMPNHSKSATKEQSVKLIEDSTLLNGMGYESFEKLELLGSGIFGNVYKVRYLNNGQIYAMKAINKANLKKKQLINNAITECNILKQANNPFIIKLHFSFQTADHLYMVLDYCEGGDLGFILREMSFEEEEAKFYIAELITVIRYLHSMNVIYRDLKPDNILIDSEGHIKLADFNLSKENKNCKPQKSLCGFSSNLSPEMVELKGEGKAADIYGIGAIIYEMIAGTPPFFSKKITMNKLLLHKYISDDLNHLLKSLLNENPNKRMGVNDNLDIRFHPWFDSINWKLLEAKKLQPPLNLCNIRKAALNNKYKNRIVCEDKIKIKDEKDKEGKVINFTFVRPQSPDK